MVAVAGTTCTQHIVWDWNGTLLDDNDAVVTAVNAVCAAFQRDPVDLQQWRAVYSRPLLRCYERLLERPVSDDDWARIDALYHETYRGLLHTCKLADGVPRALHAWAGDGRSQSLLSMWFHDELVALVVELGLYELFARIDGLRSEVGGQSKASFLEQHLEQLQLDPSDVVLVGDVADDAHAAEKIGTGCVLLTTGVMGREALAATGYPVVDSIPDAMQEITMGRVA